MALSDLPSTIPGSLSWFLPLQALSLLCPLFPPPLLGRKPLPKALVSSFAQLNASHGPSSLPHRAGLPGAGSLSCPLEIPHPLCPLQEALLGFHVPWAGSSHLCAYMWNDTVSSLLIFERR